MVQNSVPQVVYSTSGGVDKSLNLLMSSLNTPANTIDISFDVVEDSAPNYFIFNAASGESVFAFDVEVDLDVTYVTSVTRRRDVESSQLTVKKTLLFNRGPSTEKASSEKASTKSLLVDTLDTAAASTTCAPAAVALVAAGLMVTLF